MVTSRGYVIIDWAAATLGSPLAEVARTIVLTEGAAATDPSLPWGVRKLIPLLCRMYLSRYLQHRLGDLEEVRAWQGVVAAEWLVERARACLPGDYVIL